MIIELHLYLVHHPIIPSQVFHYKYSTEAIFPNSSHLASTYTSTVMNRRITTLVSEAFLGDDVRAAKLGRIVLNPRKPIEGYHDVLPNLDVGSEAVLIRHAIISGDFKSERTISLGGALFQLLRGRFSIRKNRRMYIFGRTKEYQLSNAQVHFKEACANVQEGKHTREWLEEYVIKPSVSAYMMVGYRTITDLEITSCDSRVNGMDTRADVNLVGMALPGTGLSSAATMKTLVRNESTYQRQIKNEGEVLWAVDYRKVVFKKETWQIEPEMEPEMEPERKSRLLDGQWIMKWKKRGQDSSGEHLVEVDLGDGAEPEDSDSDEDEDEDEDEEEKAQEFYFRIIPGEGVEDQFVLFSSTQKNLLPDQESNDNLPMDTSYNESTIEESTEVLSPAENEDDHEMGEDWDTRAVSLDQPARANDSSGSAGQMTGPGSRAGQKRMRDQDCGPEEIDAGDSDIVERDSKRLRDTQG